ncbi:MAG: ATP-dependent RNA helicase HrpA [Halioglobus sp.]|nr:ATP-dependent RNA helicase HrpA [Halioglobus sp.]
MHHTGTDNGEAPVISYPPDLPVSAQRSEIARAITEHQVVIVAGETGSGKTTQLPKICLELGRGRAALIGHTQPRRLAARTVAARIADELGGATGELVGYQVRFTDRVSASTAVKLMTDGILLNELRRDPLLRAYDTLIIDEAHERSLNIDFLLGYLRRILPRRPDLKVIVTSATIDVESFSRHFHGAPVIEVSGRSHPIETVYLGDPGAESDTATGDPREDDPGGEIVQCVEQIAAGAFGARGDVLVFLPGEREIRELARLLRAVDTVDVLPLYARLSQTEQNRVFDSARRRAGIRVVLATNVAETSLTVPGIRYVIDPGTARISRYSHRSRLQRLPVEAVSRASADQRRGRCGRVGPGTCLRLYSEADYDARPEFTDPEIRRTNLAAVVLQMLSLGLGDIEAFPFIDPPDSRQVRDGYRLLEELGAVDATGKLTGTGRRMARLPVDPRLGRMVLESERQGCPGEILVIASALSVQDPRERPADSRAQADQLHGRFGDPRSDFMSWLNLWRYFEEQRQALSQTQLRRLCRREFLSFSRLREWRDIHTQLSIACRQQGLRVSGDPPTGDNYPGIHRALISGLLSHLAQLGENGEYLGGGNRRLRVFPGSPQARRGHKWLVAAEIVETSRVYAREVGAIEPRWVLDLNPPALRRHYYEPHWRARTGRVMAFERTALYGLTLADRRLVHYGPLAPADSRALLIRQGLVAGVFHKYPDFLRHNRRLVRELERLEARTRRRDLLVPEQAQYEFYDERVPPDIYTARRLDAWLKREPEAARRLYMDREFLLARDPGSDVEEQFPGFLQWRDVRFRLTYEFAPGGESDGVSVTVPVALLNRAPRFLFDWLVPGLLREKCIAMVKGLPKEKRKHLVPVPDSVDRALTRLQAGDHDLGTALARELSRPGDLSLTAEDWSAVRLDDYYRMNVRVVDANGKLLGQDRDLARLVTRFRDATRQSIEAAAADAGAAHAAAADVGAAGAVSNGARQNAAVGASSLAREGLRRWDFDTLPSRFRFRQAGVDIVSWPALADRGDSVAIELCDYEEEARLRHRAGVLRLARLALASQVRQLRKQLLRGNAVNLRLAAAGLERDALVEDMVDGACVQALGLHADAPRSRDEFQRLLRTGSGEVISRALDIETVMQDALAELGEIRPALGAIPADRWPDTREDIEQQLAGLLQAGFQRDTPARWLAQYPRYFRAVRNRIERFSGQREKDRSCSLMLRGLAGPLWAGLEQRPSLLLLCDEAAEYRWMLEEFRVSLYAQNLGTRRPVSKKRIEQQWHKVADWLAKNPE